MTQRDHRTNDRQERVVYNTTPEPVRGQVPAAAPTATAEVEHPQHQVSTEHTTPEPVYNRTPVRTYDTPDVDVENVVETPLDRVRWGPIIAGLVTALSTLTLLSLLGLALGASTFDPGDRARSFGIGAGLWGGLSALLAFLVGGWVAARTAAVRGERNGMINGAMVWALAVPLLLYLLGSGISALIGTAATTGAQAAGAIAGQAADQVANNPALQATAQAGVAGFQDTARDLASPQNVAGAASTTARAAWGTLGSLLLGLGAATLGGLLGARTSRGFRGRSQGADSRAAI